jgi:hypothetical protein
VSHSSAARKFLRGVEHVKTLSGEARAFENDDAYAFETEIESRSPNHIRYRCFAIERKPCA